MLEGYNEQAKEFYSNYGLTATG
ncbi:protein of unknown function [Brevefilum fermentans]|uniref:Uncharacterized protein n=1 Tax=Candidatus Brevifilum fermentans TaxID=1986204 RepID=A0A1Y6K343_9CHLR|nr:protein of unknown function [Brevefilum fermentans]